MYLYVQKSESLKVNFKVTKFEVNRFPRLQSLRLFCVPAIQTADGRKGCDNEGCELWGAGG